VSYHVIQMSCLQLLQLQLTATTGVCWRSKPLPDVDPTIQIQNDLDVCLRNRRKAELSSMVNDLQELREMQQLREPTTDINKAIEFHHKAIDQLEMKLTTLRTLAFDVRTLTSTVVFTWCCIHIDRLLFWPPWCRARKCKHFAALTVRSPRWR